MRRFIVPGIFLLLALGSAGLIAGGIVNYVDRTSGVATTAKVVECHTVSTYKAQSDHCSGTWVIEGSLLHGGHVVYGYIDGASSDDIGHTLHVRIHGGTAYTSSLRLPIILIVLGLFMFGAFTLTGWQQARQIRAVSSASGAAVHRTTRST